MQYFASLRGIRQINGILESSSYTPMFKFNNKKDKQYIPLNKPRKSDMINVLKFKIITIFKITENNI